MEKETNYALIMKGGGVKGLAYIGTLKELTKYYEFNWYVGTSAGAITAVLLAAGYTLDELEEKLKDLKFNELIKESLIRQIWNFISKQGRYTADGLQNWISNLVIDKFYPYPYDVPLKLFKNRITIYATKRYEKALIFDSKGPNEETTCSFAVRCSMSIPFYFTPEKSNGLNVYDGGVQNNYPVEILLSTNEKPNFIGLYLGAEKILKDKNTNRVFHDMLSITTEAMDFEALKKHFNNTLIIDPNPIKTTQFNLSEKEKHFLLECGRVYALKFLVWKGKVKTDNLKIEQENLEILRNELIKSAKNKANQKKIIIIVVLAISLVFYYFIHNLNKQVRAKDEIIKTLNINCELLQKSPNNENVIPEDFFQIYFNADGKFENYNRLIKDFRLEKVILDSIEIKKILLTDNEITDDTVSINFCLKNSNITLNSEILLLSISEDYYSSGKMKKGKIGNWWAFNIDEEQSNKSERLLLFKQKIKPSECINLKIIKR